MLDLYDILRQLMGCLEANSCLMPTNYSDVRHIYIEMYFLTVKLLL